MIIIGAAAVVLVSLSRVYLGVHYIGDVIAGILFGLLIGSDIFKSRILVIYSERWIGKKISHCCNAPGDFDNLAAVSGLNLNNWLSCG